MSKFLKVIVLIFLASSIFTSVSVLAETRDHGEDTVAVANNCGNAILDKNEECDYGIKNGQWPQACSNECTWNEESFRKTSQATKEI